MSDDVDPELVEWVRSLPDGTEIHWYEDSAPPWRSWVDVQVETLESAGFNWVWTIVSEDDTDCSLDDIVWPKDIETPDGRAWSVDTINTAIVQWCATHAGRTVVPVFQPVHGPSPIMAKAVAAIEAVKAGTIDTYLIKPGAKEGGEGRSIRVTDGVMDWMLGIEFPDD